MFAEVKLQPPLAAESSSDARTASAVGELELRLPGRRSVVVPRGFDRQTLIGLLDVLEAGAVEFARREAGR